MIFHLAAIVSGEAEADFEKGYRINLDGTRALFEAIRHEGARQPYRPRVVFTSSIAVFGAPFPEAIGDEFFPTPLTSYGTQKAIDELLLSDYSRRGFFDGIGIRLPTICVRPGKPNKAASGFFSNILREPLSARRRCCRSPRTSAIGMPARAPRSASCCMRRRWITRRSARRRNLTMPGLSATVGEQIEALRRVAGDGAVDADPPRARSDDRRIVAGWPRNFDPRARDGARLQGGKPSTRSSASISRTNSAAGCRGEDDVSDGATADAEARARPALRSWHGRRTRGGGGDVRARRRTRSPTTPRRAAISATRCWNSAAARRR